MCVSQVSLAWLVGVHDELVGYGYGTRVGYTGWVTGRVIPGYTQPPRSQLLEEQALTAKRAPDHPCRGWGVGGQCAADVLGPTTGASELPGTTLRARSVPLQGPSLYLGPLLGQRARFHVLFLKVSQNGKVSPESVEKACHSP